VTNQVVDVRWLSWFGATKSLTTTGGLAVGLASTNLDITCSPECITNVEPRTPSLFFSDSGAICVITNMVADPTALLPVVVIGNRSNYVGQIQTNDLYLDYPAREFSYSLNGVALTNHMSLPLYVTNIFSEVDIYGFETLPSAAGDQFALDNVQVIVTNAGKDVWTFDVTAKGQVFDQTNASAPTLSATGFAFLSDAQATASGSVWWATLRLPNGTETNLMADSANVTNWAFADVFTSQAALDAAYSNGIYQLDILGASNGLYQSSLNLSGDTYPNTPQIVNFDPAQTVNASQDFTLQWNSSGGTNDLVILEVDDAQGNPILVTPHFGESNALNGAVTSFTIVANTLQASSTYQGLLMFSRPVSVDTNTIPGVTGAASYFEQTAFPLATISLADLALAAVGSSSTTSVNNALGYTMTVTNMGPNNAASVQLLDALPDRVTFGSATSSVGNCVYSNGVVTCPLGTILNGASAAVSIIVTASTPGDVCNSATVTSSTADPIAANNSVSVCTPAVVYDLAVTAFTAPKKIELSDKKTNVVGKLSVTIQNRGPNAEAIPDLEALSNLVTITLQPIGTSTNCVPPTAELVPPKITFPFTLTSAKTLKISYTVNFTCANDPLATTKTANHDDYQYLVTVHHEALDGQPDSYPADDTCPHDALGVDPFDGKIKDKGCGLKNPDGTFGPLVTDIVDTRTP
jgi:uncharacterized repeat protein (TIGR01451 family)